MMKRSHLSLAAALPVALLFACAANAQTTPSPAETTEAPSQEMQQEKMQQTSPEQAQEHETEAQQRATALPQSSPANRTMHMENRSRTGRFSTLAGSKGYITQSGAASDAWLSQHFSACDSNHDGRITRSEYTECRDQKNPPQQ